jgi:hypothetical protein
MARESVDALVLATVNAPYKHLLTAEQLAAAIRAPIGSEWIVHLATLYTDVRPPLVVEFAQRHGIDRVALAASYIAVRAATGERNEVFEREIGIYLKSGQHPSSS